MYTVGKNTVQFRHHWHHTLVSHKTRSSGIPTFTPHNISWKNLQIAIDEIIGNVLFLSKKWNETQLRRVKREKDDWD